MAWIENIRDVIGDPEDGKSAVTPSRNWSAVVPNSGSIEKTTLRTWAVKGADVILSVNYASAKVTWSDGEIELASEEGKSETVKLSVTKEIEEFTITANWFYESELYKDPVSDDGMVYLDIYDPDGSTVKWEKNEGSGTTVTNEFAMANVENVGQTPSSKLTAGREYRSEQVKGRYSYDRWRKYLVGVYYSLILAGEEIATEESEDNGEKWTRISVGLIGTVPWETKSLTAEAGETYTLTKEFKDTLIPELNIREDVTLSWKWTCDAEKTHEETAGSRGGGSSSGGAGGGSGGSGGTGSEGKPQTEYPEDDEFLLDGVEANPTSAVYVAGKGWRRVISWRVEPESLSKNWDWDGTRTIYVVGDADLVALSTDEDWVTIDGSKLGFEQNTGSGRSGSVTVTVNVRSVPYFRTYDAETDSLEDATGEYSSRYEDSCEVAVYQGANGSELSDEELEEALETAVAEKKSSGFSGAFSGTASKWLSVDCAYLDIASGGSAIVNVYASAAPNLAFESGGEYFTVTNLGRTGDGVNFPFAVKIESISEEDGAEGSLRISGSDIDETVYVEVNTSAPWISADPSLLYSYQTPEMWEWTSYVRSARKFKLSNFADLPEWIGVDWKLSNSESDWEEVTADTVFPAVEKTAGGKWMIPVFRIFAGENSESGCRDAAIKFRTEDDDVAGTRSATITVLQCGGEVVENKLARNFYYVGGSQQVLTLEGAAQAGWAWNISGSFSWIRALETSGTGENARFAVEFSVDANSGDAVREAAFRVTFTSPDSKAAAQQDITIRQGIVASTSESIAILEGAELNFNSSGDALEVKVETEGVEPIFSCDSVMGWQLWGIDLVSAEASGSKAIYTYSIELYKNTDLKKLSGEFTFTLPESNGGNSVTGTWSQAIEIPKELRSFTDAVFEDRNRWKFFGRKWSGL